MTTFQQLRTQNNRISHWWPSISKILQWVSSALGSWHTLKQQKTMESENTIIANTGVVHGLYVHWGARGFHLTAAKFVFTRSRWRLQSYLLTLMHQTYHTPLPEKCEYVWEYCTDTVSRYFSWCFLKALDHIRMFYHVSKDRGLSIIMLLATGGSLLSPPLYYWYFPFWKPCCIILLLTHRYAYTYMSTGSYFSRSEFAFL